jgi:hypothetical protein
VGGPVAQAPKVSEVSSLFQVRVRELVPERTAAEREANRRERLDAHIAKLTAAIKDEVDRQLYAVKVPRG